METIKIEIPEGKEAEQVETTDGIVIKWKDKEKPFDYKDFKTFADAEKFAVRNLPFDYQEYVSSITDSAPAHIKAVSRLILFCRVLNYDPATKKSWIPTWDNGSERKWAPYFQYSAGSGFAFSGSDCDCDDTVTYVGSRLCFKTEAISNYAGTQFIETYREFLTINK